VLALVRTTFPLGSTLATVLCSRLVEGGSGSRMRIVTVANHLGPRGGLERTQLSMCSALARRGHDVAVAFVSGGDFTGDWATISDTMVQIKGTLPRRRDLSGSVRGIIGALRACRRLRPDAVLVYRYWDVPFAVALKALSGAPVVFYLCLPPPASVPRWLRAALARVDRTVSVSQDTARRWARLGVRPATTTVVLTGIDLERFTPAAEQQRRATRAGLEVPEDAFVVVYAGRIGREKGVDVLFRAFRLLVAARAQSDPWLVVAGGPSLGADPEDSERYRLELDKLGEGLPVRLLGVRPEVVDVIASADVAVVPSLWPEPLARGLIEPLACGVPVVATEVGGNPEVLDGWLARYLVPAGDEGELARAIGSLVAWRVDDPSLGDRCRQAVVGRFSLEREADDVERILAEETGR
jgi:glycosyltransferase involved in cell wall biosynthesis